MPSVLYRGVALLLVLYAAGHTNGFWRANPEWGVDALLQSLRTTSFVVQGTPSRTYWGFYLGFGFFCSILLLFSAGLSWQLARLPAAMLQELRLLRWVFAATFAALSAVTARYFFPAPVIFSLLITIGLTAAAWVNG